MAVCVNLRAPRIVIPDQAASITSAYGNYQARRSIFADRLRPLFDALICLNLRISPGNSDSVTGTAIIHEIRIARRNPALYATFLEQTRPNYAGRVRLRTQRIFVLRMRRYDSSVAFGPCQPSCFPGSVFSGG